MGILDRAKELLRKLLNWVARLSPYLIQVDTFTILLASMLRSLLS